MKSIVEIQNLRRMRDLLLPRLLSGHANVSCRTMKAKKVI